MWSPEEHPWQYDLLDRLPRGIDSAQLEMFMQLTPSERIDELQRLADFAEPFVRASDGNPVR
jgi:hypothetical protein